MTAEVNDVAEKSSENQLAEWYLHCERVASGDIAQRSSADNTHAQKNGGAGGPQCDRPNSVELKHSEGASVHPNVIPVLAKQ